MADAIDNFKPQRRKDWHLDREFVTAAVRAAEPHVAYEARQLLSDVAAHVHWCRTVAGLPQTVEAVFAKQTVEEYIAHGCPNLADVSRGNRRSALRRVAEVLLPDVWETARTVPYTASRAPAPYSTAEVAAFRSWANSRPTATQRADAFALIALGIGCGLSPEDINPLRAEQVTITADGVLVTVSGRRARTVVCRRGFESELLEAVDGIESDQFVFRRNRPDSRAGSNYLSHFVDRHTPVGQLRFNGQRARVTWLVHHLNVGTPLAVLLAAAGIKKVDGLDRYLPYLNAPTSADTHRLLRGSDNP